LVADAWVPGFVLATLAWRHGDPPQFCGVVVVVPVVVVVEPVVVDPAGTVVVVVEPVVVDPAGTVVVVVEPVVVVPAGTVVVVVELVVVVPVEVVSASVVVVVDVTAEPVTVIGAETPDTPEELSVTSSVVVSGSTRVRLTVAKPLVNTTLLPVLQSPWAG
jgi:hypothetical protein